MPLVMEANGGWSKCAQKCISSQFLTATVFFRDEEGRDCEGSKDLLASPFYKRVWRID